MSNKLGAFVVGGLVGAAVALLYAPRTGVETRALVTEKMNTAWGGAQDFGAQAQVNAQQAYQTAVERGQVVAQDVAARGQSVAQNVAARGQEIYGQAQARVQEAAGAVRPVITDKNDQLREKIETARQRIAAQVARNAEEAVEAADPAAVDPAAVAEEALEAQAEVPQDAQPAAGEAERL